MPDLAPPVDRPDPTPRYTLDLTVHADTSVLVLAGHLDADATDALRTLLEVAPAPGALEVRAGDVTGVDLGAIDPLLDLALARTRAGLSPVLIVSAGPALRDLLSALGLPTTPPVRLG